MIVLANDHWLRCRTSVKAKMGKVGKGWRRVVARLTGSLLPGHSEGEAKVHGISGGTCRIRACLAESHAGAD
jgi:hypothetical protein